MRNTAAIILAILLVTAQSASAASDVRGPTKVPAYKIIGENQDGIEAGRFVPTQPRVPGRDDVILGEQIQGGDTWYDYQTSGSTGKMIAVDDVSGVHITWMDGFTNENGGTRQQMYNYYVDGAWANDGGVPAPPGTRSGYGNIIVSDEEEQRAVLFCHAVGILQGEDPTTLVLVDFARGWGAFESFLTPNYPATRILWPQGVLSPDGDLHVVYNRSDAGMLSYTGTDFQAGQPSFPDVPIEISPTSLNTYRIARSPNSARAVITWISARTAIPAPPEWDGLLAYQINNDLWMVWTDDGENWNFDNPLNVTNVIRTDPQLEDTVAAMGDTLRPFTTHDVIFDENDMIHIVFEARGMWEMPTYDAELDRPPIWGQTLDASILFHWTEEDCTFSPVADGWYSHLEVDSVGAFIIWPQPGAWKSNVCAPSLAYGADGALYCVFNYYPLNDYNDYVDNSGRVNGDIAVTVSDDNGRSWHYPTMLAQTRSHLPEPGDGMCEEYPTLAEKVDDNLHILYILDHEAGSVVQDENANNTLNEVYYLKVPVEEVRRDSIWEGPNFHVREPSSVNDPSVSAPSAFELTGAFPNPFNSTTRIEYNLNVRQKVELAIYSTSGQRVATLFTGESLPGKHQVTLTADGLPAGVYFARLTNGEKTATMKIALVK